MSTAAAQQPVIDEQNARHEHQLELEWLYDKHQLLPRVRQAFAECEGFFQKLIAIQGLTEKFGFDCLAQIAIHKRATVPAMIGALRHHGDTAQEVANLLTRAVNGKLLTYADRDQQFIVIYEIGDGLQLELEKFQYPLPMVVQPKELVSNLDSGYLTGKGSVILRDNHHDGDVCLDHLNRMNAQVFSVNLDVAMTIHNRWKGLDKQAQDETWEEFKKRKKAFEKYDRTAKDVLNILLQEGNEVHLTHKYDFRGRSYCVGYHVTYQGADWNKAVIEFAEKETLNDA